MRTASAAALTSGTNVVYSDANGVATTAYVPGSRFSPTDGLTVRACWSANDFPAGTCPQTPATATLTVISEALSVSISTNALIEIGPTGLDYIKTYLVQVVDSSGNAKAGVEISPVDRPAALLQGRMAWWPATSGPRCSARPATTKT